MESLRAGGSCGVGLLLECAGLGSCSGVAIGAVAAGVSMPGHQVCFHAGLNELPPAVGEGLQFAG